MPFGRKSDERRYKFTPPRPVDVPEFRKLIRAAGYDDYVDRIAIHVGEWPGSEPVEHIALQPGFERLIRYVGEAVPAKPYPDRIEIVTNDPSTPLERALDVTGLIDRTFQPGLFRHVYRGIVSAGKNKGAGQIWRLEYDR
jgi:hypothetical protein